MSCPSRRGTGLPRCSACRRTTCARRRRPLGGGLGGDPRGSALRADRADLPVYASAEGGGGAIIITNEPIDYVRRPEPLLSVRDSYGCYVIGDSMSPAYEQGDLLLIHPGRPVRPGDDCVFVRDQGDGSQHALVKRLLRITPEKWRVRQFNPAKDFDLDRAVAEGPADRRQVCPLVPDYRKYSYLARSGRSGSAP